MANGNYTNPPSESEPGEPLNSPPKYQAGDLVIPHGKEGQQLSEPRPIVEVLPPVGGAVYYRLEGESGGLEEWRLRRPGEPWQEPSNGAAANALTGLESLKWLAAHGGRFCKVAAWNESAPWCTAPGKQAFPANWQDTPLSLDQVKSHLLAGGNVGLLTGQHSGNDSTGRIVIIDADESYSGFCKMFPELAAAPAIVRAGADRGKILLLVTGPRPPASKSFKRKPTDKQPFCEFLSTGRQGVAAGIHPSGAVYELRNVEKGLPCFTPAGVNAILEAYTRQGLKEFEEQRTAQHNHQAQATREHGGDGLRESVLERWPTEQIFTHFGRAGELRRYGEESRLMGNGGLLVNQDGRWFCFSDDTGGGPFEAWQYCETGNTAVPSGRKFYELLCKMAAAGGIPIPQRPQHSGLIPPEEPPDDTLEAPPAGAVKTFADMAGMIGPVSWAWNKWLPNGLLTIFAGESGAGKSGACLRLAACYLRGLPWPDGTPFTGEPGAVLWCEAEAAQAVNLDRAKAWNLPLDLLYTPLDNPLDDLKLDQESHRAALVSKAKMPEVKLIIIDSLRGILGRADENASETNNFIKWLAALARDTGKPIILTHHLRKRSVFDGEGVELERLRGSSAIVQTARLVWALDIPDPAQKDKKRLSVIKSNLDKFPGPLGMTISDQGVSFGAAPEQPHMETASDKAADLLLSLLGNFPRPATEIEQEFDHAGISIATMKRAKSKLGIVSIRDREGWKWALPARGEDISQ